MIVRILTEPVRARTRRELAYALTGAVMAAPVFVLPLIAVVFSVLSALTIGLPFLVGVLFLARGTIRYFRAPARRLLGWDWASPPRRTARGPIGWSLAVLRDGAAWRALGYCFVRFPLAAATAYLGIVLVGAGLLALTYPAWWSLYPQDNTWAYSWVLAAQGAAALLALPWFVRVLVFVDRLLVRALLEPDRGRARIAALESARAALRADAAAVLRRVERDLHDGTQARLVALGVTLARIENKSTDEVVRTMAGHARGDVTAALAELRDIVRGIHPPVLDDGLPTALETLASRSAVPVELRIDLPGRLPDETATAVYFTVAELLTNVARHARASQVILDLREQGGWLRLVVRDDGRGGASQHRAGTGLAGLARRAAALDGTLAIDSPDGGPTAVAVTLPKEV